MATPPGADAFTSIYRQYKEDTEYIAGWLSEKSAQCGHRTTPKSAKVATTAQPRLKGKARKLAKESAKAGANSGAAASPGYTIKVSDFIPMATSIARFTPNIQVPAGLGKLFSRAITERRRVSDWFNSPHGEHLDEDDRSHAHFIDVLEKAYDILRPLIAYVSRKPKKTATVKGTDSKQLPLQNALDRLKVEETPEHEESQPAEESTEEMKKLPVVTPVGIEHDESETEAEFFFAIQSFLLEIKKIRKTITKL